MAIAIAARSNWQKDNAGLCQNIQARCGSWCFVKPRTSFCFQDCQVAGQKQAFPRRWDEPGVCGCRTWRLKPRVFVSTPNMEAATTVGLRFVTFQYRAAKLRFNVARDVEPPLATLQIQCVCGCGSQIKVGGGGGGVRLKMVLLRRIVAEFSPRAFDQSWFVDPPH